MTTDKSRADALTYQEVEALAEKHGFAISAFDYTDSNSLVDLVNDALRSMGQPEPRAEVTDCGCATNEACKMKTDGSCWRAD